MCIGNIRNGTSALADYTETHNKASLRRAFYYYGIIFFLDLVQDLVVYFPQENLFMLSGYQAYY